MPRTLNATLEAALDSRNFSPVIRGWLGDDQTQDIEVKIIRYKIHLTELDITFFYDGELNKGEITIERGVIVNGTEYTVDSMPFTLYDIKLERKFYTAKGRISVGSYYLDAGDVTYETAIDTWGIAIEAQAFTFTYLDDSAAWKGYQFLPAGKQIITNNMESFLSMLRQKYFIFITDYIGVSPLVFSADDTKNRSVDHTIALTHADIWDDSDTTRVFRWKDEVETIHTGGIAGNPIHNLGYIESTDSAPDVFNPNPGKLLRVTLPFHLKYVTGDKVTFTSPFGVQTLTGVLEVTEIFDIKGEPSWMIELGLLQYFANTEGGALPSTIERVSNYTPLNTSTFNNILSANDNNVQAAFETLDEHGHTTPTPAQVGSIPNDGWIAGTGTWSYSSADAPTFVASVPDADAALMNVGDRWKITQTTAKYFIVTAKGAPSGGFTPVTIYGGTDYTLANAAITSPYYSHVKSPLGFPLSPAKWTVTVTDTSTHTQATPTASTWYNLGSISISVPIGVWNVRYDAFISSDESGTDTNAYVTLSTANNSESDAGNTMGVGITAVGASVVGIAETVQKTILLSPTTKTTYYLNERVNVLTVNGIAILGAISSTIIKAVCAYL